jgi:hypothetical protein
MSKPPRSRAASSTSLRDVGAFAGEGDRRGAADAAVAAGDERLAAKQTPRASVAFLAMIGTRRHEAGETRPGLRLRLEGRLGIELARIAQFPRGRRIIEAEHGGGGIDRALNARSANRCVGGGLLGAHALLPLLDLRHATKTNIRSLNAARPRLFRAGGCLR